MVSTPKAPDPNTTAAAQSAANRDTATSQQLLNMTNQVTPDGSLTYNQTGTNSYIDSLTGKTVTMPQFTATQTLSAANQGIYNSNKAAEQNIANIAKNQSASIGNLLNTQMDTSKLPQAKDPNSITAPTYQQMGAGPQLKSQIGANDFSADRQKVEDALMARMDPYLSRDRQALETSLANKGIQVGSAAYKASMDDYNRGTNDARLGAILNAGQEQNRMFGLEKDQATFGNNAQQQMFQNAGTTTSYNNSLQDQGFANQQALYGMSDSARKSALQEQMALRNQPINEISALLSGSQVSMPQFTNTPQTGVGGVDYTGLVNQKYQADLAASQAKMGGLFGLLGAGVSAFSDRRLKDDIKPVGKLDNGLTVYSYRMHGDPATQIGLMADEVAAVRPEAVHVHESGYAKVDYAQAVEG